jgi:putative ABC transport system substrate-binding protein
LSRALRHPDATTYGGDRVRRREFIGGFAVAAVLQVVGGLAQAASRRPLVAYLIGGSKSAADRYFGGFSEGMRELGYVAGRDYTFDGRYADGNLARAPLLAEELVRLNPDVIVSGTMAGVTTAKKLTDTIPIVSPSLVEPVGFGFAASHARPGGNVTGVLLTVEDLPSKQLALMVEMVPGARKVGLLVNTNNPNNPSQRRNMEAAAHALGVSLLPLEVALPDDLHAALQTLTREEIKAVFVLTDAMFLSERKRIALFAMAVRLPTVFAAREHVEDGGLMSYGVDQRETWRRTATFVDKILKGAKPGDLPIEFPTKLQLVINLTAAKGLGLTVPPMLLARADEVIE